MPQGSEPFVLFSKHAQDHDDGNGERDYINIPVSPGELRHRLKIHSVPSYDNRKREKEGCEDGQDFHGLCVLRRDP